MQAQPTILAFQDPVLSVVKFENLQPPKLAMLKLVSFSVSCSVVFDSSQNSRIESTTLCSPPGSSVHGILQARILQWVAIPFSKGSFWLRDTDLLHCRQILYCPSQQSSQLNYFRIGIFIALC